MGAKLPSPFQKRVLIPFWVLRMLFSLALIGIYATAVGFVAYYNDNNDNDSYIDNSRPSSSVEKTAVAVVAVLLAFMVISLIFDIVEIILFARRRLTPVVFLVLNVLQTAIWLVFFCLAVAGAATTRNGALGTVLYLITFLLSLGLMIYASVVLHRHRSSRGAYTPANQTSGLEAQHTAYPPQTQEPYYAAPVPQLPHGAANTYYNAPQEAGYYGQQAPQARNSAYPMNPSGYETHKAAQAHENPAGAVYSGGSIELPNRTH
ncbi:hypothetical protein K402DRAFT_122938 [Aulographum hederae CBS 113979]|uniref:MARVEL domain-containing protein n=1 Tax=Aulographum hederae CBS 113979 TaxID=1176131 RepID=A0A6G1HE71_9PEZI|nr:hypothetical protein K402DRAFT_122938 [Aulographum hederae CBS 113979]